MRTSMRQVLVCQLLTVQVTQQGQYMIVIAAFISIIHKIRLLTYDHNRCRCCSVIHDASIRATITFYFKFNWIKEHAVSHCFKLIFELMPSWGRQTNVVCVCLHMIEINSIQWLSSPFSSRYLLKAAFKTSHINCLFNFTKVPRGCLTADGNLVPATADENHLPKDFKVGHAAKILLKKEGGMWR